MNNLNTMPQVIFRQEYCFDRMRQLGCEGTIMIKAHRVEIVPSPHIHYFNNLITLNDNEVVDKT